MSTLEYPFEDLAIDIDGRQAGAFTGTAFLQDDVGGFWVSAICLTEPQQVQLLMSGTTLSRQLFLAIADALYASPHASEAWAAHVEENKSDAA